MHLGLIEERARTERIITGFAVVMGAEGVEMTDLAQMRADYDAFLVSDEKKIDRDKLELMQALGIAR